MSFLKSSLVRRCEGGSGARKSWSPGIFKVELFTKFSKFCLSNFFNALSDSNNNKC